MKSFSAAAIWRAARAYFRPPAVRDLAAMRAFLAREAALLSQYSTFAFSRNTLGYFGQHALHSERFKGDMRVCRWESFAAVLADLTVLTEGRLRAAAGPHAPRLVDLLAECYASILAGHERPLHRPDGWDAEVAALRERLARAQLAPPHGPNQVAPTAARRVFDVLPIYSGNHPVDRATIDSMIRMGEVGFFQRLTRLLDAQAVVRDALHVAGDGAGETAGID